MDNLLEIFKKRTSCRNFNGRLLTREEIITCVEAGRLSPSACNSQPVKYFVTNKKDKIRKITEEGMGKMIPNKWLNESGAIIVLANDIPLLEKIGSFASGIKYNELDTGIAGEHLVLQAESMGISSCWIGWFREKKLKEILEIPEQFKIISVIALGFARNRSSSPAKHEISKILFFR